MIFGVSYELALAFIRMGIKTYWKRYTLIFLPIFIILYLLKRLGLFSRGNLPKYRVQNSGKAENSPLSGKHMIFLGSSVTRGLMAGGKSFVDMIAYRTNCTVLKEAVSGTTLIDNGPKSYISRLKKIDPNSKCDLFICQLSTNDASKKAPLGRMSASKELQSLDTKTVCGAIEYIIAYAKQTWDCPVVFYTNPQYPSPQYREMVVALKKIAKKWEIQVVDLWDHQEINQDCNRKPYMVDAIHPARKGYQAWTPVIETGLAKALAGEQINFPQATELSEETLKQAKSKAAIKKSLSRVAALAVAVVVILGGSGWQTLNDTSGVIKAGNNSRYNPDQLTPLEDSPLKGKTVLCLGASVAMGRSSRNITYCEYLEALDQAIVIKEAIAGTTIAVKEDISYLPRLQQYGADTQVDIILVQLSSNDATMGSSLGVLTDSYDISDIDTSTFVGGLEALIIYTRETWDCPFVIYSNPVFEAGAFYNPAAYAEMVEVTKQVAEKWGIGYLNMWEDEDMLAVSSSDHNLYMSDPVHPTKAGYLLWWMPKIQESLYQYF